ncbi:MAG: hypothetical protein ACW98J_08795 [Candidatus Thorarchaeota archaeon]|jgi:hypothetical protein
MKGQYESKSFEKALDSLSDYFILVLPERITSIAVQPYRKGMDMLKTMILSGPLLSFSYRTDWIMIRNWMLSYLVDATKSEAGSEAIAIIDRAGNDLEKLQKTTKSDKEWGQMLKHLFMRTLWKVQKEEKRRKK